MNKNNSSVSSSRENYDEEPRIDIFELVHAIWSKKWQVVLVSSVFAVSSILYALSLSDEYKSTAVLTSASASSGSSLSKLAGKYSGLASLAGINFKGGGANESNIVIAMELLKSRGFLQKFISDHELEIEIMAVSGWDSTRNKLIFDNDIFNVKTKTWVGDFSYNENELKQPSGWELYKGIIDNIQISREDKTGFVSINATHYSPYVAKRWVDLLVRAINKHLQDKTREESLNSIRYLEKQIETTSISEMRSIFFQLIEEQTKNLMLADVSTEFVFKTISPAMVSAKKSGPFRAVMVVLSTFLGAIFGAVFVLIRHFGQKIG